MADTITAVDPLEFAGPIKIFHLDNDRRGFPETFDRLYAVQSPRGLRSWIGRDDDGAVVLHVARFVSRFALGDDVGTGGLFGNLLAARTHRSFFPIVKLMRRAIADCRDEARCDFLYTDPNARAEGVMKAAGMKHVATFDRYTLPISHRRLVVALALRAFHALLRRRAYAARGTHHAASAYDPGDTDAMLGDSARLRPLRGRDLYRSRYAGYPGPADHWFVFHERRRPDTPVASAFVRGPDERGVAWLNSLRAASDVRVASLVPSLVGALRPLGCERLTVEVLADSPLARNFQHAGFIRRHDTTPLHALPLTPLGERMVAALPESELLRIDADP